MLPNQNQVDQRDYRDQQFYNKSGSKDTFKINEAEGNRHSIFNDFDSSPENNNQLTAIKNEKIQSSIIPSQSEIATIDYKQKTDKSTKLLI